VRSLNILLKFARLYDFGHPRTAAQFETAWGELKNAIGLQDEAGLLLSASGDQLLLDGVPLESAAAEKSFARLLSSAGIASIHFAPKVTQQSLATLVKAFPTGGAKPSVLAMQLKTALEDDPGIQINEICFVPADSAVVKGGVAATLAAKTFGLTGDKYNEVFSDPHKLLQLITAAEGTRPNVGGDGSVQPEGMLGAGSAARKGFGSKKRRRPANGQAQAGSGADAAATGTQNATGSAELGFLDAIDDEDYGDEGDYEDGLEGAPASGATVPEDIAKLPKARVVRSGARRKGKQSLIPDGASFFTGATAQELASGGTMVQAPATFMADETMIETGLVGMSHEELQGILKMLRHVARVSKEVESTDEQTREFQTRVALLPKKSRITLAQALNAMAANAPVESADQPTLMRLAEQVAIRFALESFERGDVEVDAVRQMLHGMSREIASLRKILGKHEEKMVEAGMRVQPLAEMLADQFWEEVPEEKRQEILMSSNAWCIPISNMRSTIEALTKKGEDGKVRDILRNFAECIRNEKPDARRAAALGIAELAPSYGSFDEPLFIATIREVGVQLSEEKDADLRSLVSAAFVRLAQEAGIRRSYAGMQRASELVEYIEAEAPASAKNLRGRVEVESRMADFLDDAMRSGTVPTGLLTLMRRVPGASAEILAQKFGRSGFREDAELALETLKNLGPEAHAHLRELLNTGSANAAVDTVGILARTDLATLDFLLAKRLKEFPRSSHDRVVRQLAGSGAPERGRLLLDIFDNLDSFVQPLAIDEIGLAGEREAEARLIRLAEGDLPPNATPYLQLKAIEALGRLRTAGAEKVLRKILEEKQMWRWVSQQELRTVAAQAMERIDPEWMNYFLPKSGLNTDELALEPLDPDPTSNWVRQRRYLRLRFDDPIPASTVDLKENCDVKVPEMNLGGGVALSDQRLHPGTVVTLRLNPRSKSVKAQAIVRDANTQARAFELVEMDLEERAKLRKMLAQFGRRLRVAALENRGRGKTRQIFSNLNE
jgi:hypothetical protein